MDQPCSASPRSVLVTGASRGIGQAIARAFAVQGDLVATLDRQGAGPGPVPGAAHPVLALAGSVSDAAAVDAAFSAAEEAHGPVTVLVANAGITRDAPLLALSDDAFDQVIDTNLAGTFRCLRRAARPMIKARHGRIILIGSVVGLAGSAGQTNYAASKAALVGLARSAAKEIGRGDITCNVVAPGFIETDMTEALSEDKRSKYLRQIPARRFGQVEDVAGVVTFLASPAASYINGAVIAVDGGLGG